MLNFETRMDLTYGGSDHSSANWAGRGGRGGAKGTGRGGWGRSFVPGRGRGGNQGSTNPRQGGGYPNKRQYNNKKPTQPAKSASRRATPQLSVGIVSKKITPQRRSMSLLPRRLHMVLTPIGILIPVQLTM